MIEITNEAKHLINEIKKHKTPKKTRNKKDLDPFF